MLKIRFLVSDLRFLYIYVIINQLKTITFISDNYEYILT